MKTTYYLLIALFAIGCNTAASQSDAKFPLYFSETLSLNPNLKSPIKNIDKAKLESQLTAKWDMEYNIYIKNGDNETKKMIIDCNTCLKLNDAFVRTEIYSEIQFYIARMKRCKAIKRAVKAMPSAKSYIADFQLDKNFAHMAPSVMAIIISREDEEKAKRAANWFEMANIKSVEKRGPEYSVYRDNSNGIQHVKLLAKGDFNNDAVEDVMVSVGNRLEGGSYSAYYVYILTRFDPKKKYQLIEQF